MQQQLDRRTNHRQAPAQRYHGRSADANCRQSTDDKKNIIEPTTPRGKPEPTHSTVKRVLKHLVSATILSSLATYALVLVRKDWPPDGRLRNPDGAADPLQGKWWVSPNLTRADRIMLAVAHPDDECLFFSPTLLNILSPRLVNRTDSNDHLKPNNEPSDPARVELESPRLHILSLSSGNAEGLGIKRTREMRASCWAFGIPSTECIVLDHPDLPDSMSVWWPEKTIAEYVRLYVDLWNIDAIITFDHHGISGHANHRAIAAALSRLVHTDAQFPMTFMLRSTSIIEKYASLLSLPYSLYRHRRNRKSFLPQLTRPSSHLSRDKKRVAELVCQSLNHLVDKERLVASSPTGYQEAASRSGRSVITDSRLSSHTSFFLSTPTQYYEGRRAFNQHVSQNVWFRRLWLVSSRFMWINELSRVVPLDRRFEDDPSLLHSSAAENVVFPGEPGSAAPKAPSRPDSSPADNAPMDTPY